MKYYVGIDIGGTSVKHGIMDGDGILLKTGSFPTSLEDYEVLKKDITDEINRYKEQFDLSGVGISIPGVLDKVNGRVHSFCGTVGCMEHTDLRADIQTLVGLSTTIEKDGNCAALAEHWIGSAQGTASSAVIVLGTGIGGALIVNNRLVRGRHYLAGEYGLMVMNRQADFGGFMNWEEDGGSMVSTINRVNVLLNQQLDGKEIFHLAQKDDTVAKELELFIQGIACGVYNLQVMFDPDIILLGGAVSTRTDLIDRVKEKLHTIDGGEFSQYVQLDTCDYGGDANLIGALYHHLKTCTAFE